MGFPGIGGRSGSVVTGSGVRVLALVTEAFGGHGGIAQYNRDFLSALARCDGVGDVIVLPRRTATSVSTLPPGVRQLRPVESKLGYSLSALWTAMTQQPIEVVFCGHLFMAPLAAGICRAFECSAMAPGPWDRSLLARTLGAVASVSGNRRGSLPRSAAIRDVGCCNGSESIQRE